MQSLDLPLPPPPYGEPLTCEQIGNILVDHFMEAFKVDLIEARVRALATVARMLEMGLLTEWGMTHDGEPLFVPGIVQQVVIVKEV